MKKLFFASVLFAAMFAQPAMADDIPFRQQRREVFRVTPVHQGDIVFLGNSITNFGVWPEMFGSDVKIVNRGISGIGSAEVAQHIDLIAEGKPAKLFIMLGINDYETPEVVVPSLRKIVAAMKEQSPETEIYIQSVLPCNLAVRKPVVAPLNEELKAMCEELELPYIDIYSLLADNGNPKGMVSSYTNDQLHVLASGYREWTKALEPYIGHSTVWSSEGNTTVNGLSTINNIRLSEYGMLPVNDGDVLMLGDYNVMTAEWQEMLSAPRVKNRGFGQAWGYTLTVDHLSKVIPTVVKGNPESVFIQCGLKDLDGTNSSVVEGTWTKYESVVADILARAPQTTVYVQSVIPSAFAANNTATITPFNELMKTYAEATDRVEFVDLYGALVDEKTGALAEKYRGANTAQSHGVNGRAYLRWANLIAPLIEGAVAPAELTDEEFEQSETLYDAKAAMRGAEGTAETVGGKTQEAIDNLKSALNGGNLEEIKAALAEFNSSIVLPECSTEEVEYWYSMQTPLRGATYVTLTGGVLNSTAWSGALTQQWKFIERQDGTLDIVNRSTGQFVNSAATYNQAVPVKSVSPANGWNLAAAETSGLFVITSGTAQLNRNPSASIVNWGGGTNLADLGCQFKIELREKVEIPKEEPKEDPKEEDPKEEPGGGDDDDSSITSVTVGSSAGALYDLQGRKVVNPAAGIYIRNGKKISLR